MVEIIPGHRLNRRCYLNVIFGDVVRPMLATRGQPLSKEELTAGIKMDDNLHKSIATEY